MRPETYKLRDNWLNAKSNKQLDTFYSNIGKNVTVEILQESNILIEHILKKILLRKTP